MKGKSFFVFFFGSKIGLLLLGLISITCSSLVAQSSEEKEKPKTNLDLELKITSDHNFRGYNYAALKSQRNNTPYKSFDPTPAFQPYFVYHTPLEGLKTLFWGNFFLNNTRDKDSDMYLLQDSPGGDDKWSKVQNDPSQFYPTKTKRYKERNGIGRYDGIFFGIYYEWNTIIGTWSFGTWIWNNLDRFGKYSWQEYFLWYSPNVLKVLNPRFEFFLNTSFDSGGSATTPLGTTNGQNYASLETSHKFSFGNHFGITPKIKMGYVANNNNTDKKAGVSNIISTLKFNYDMIDITVNALYRPDPNLYDTSDVNRTDGRLPDPSKQYGIYRAYYEELEKRYPKEIANWIGYQTGNQKFEKTIFFFTIAYNGSF